ncbi:hypothetical protein MKW94_003033, partial [Papaver nudicaule]|nr:hypothetical protein [Papaver nudicaule]
SDCFTSMGCTCYSSKAWCLGIRMRQCACIRHGEVDCFRVVAVLRELVNG